MSLPLGLALAALSALATNIGFLLRHRGAVTAPDVEVRRPLRSIAGLFRQRWWTIGYLVAAAALIPAPTRAAGVDKGRPKGDPAPAPA